MFRKLKERLKMLSRNTDNIKKIQTNCLGMKTTMPQMELGHNTCLNRRRLKTYQVSLLIIME